MHYRIIRRPESPPCETSSLPHPSGDATLAQLDVESWGWAYAYAKPSGIIRALAVLPADASPDAEGQEFEIESASDGTGLIFTNQEDATLRYTAQVTDTAQYSPLFTDTLARLLSAYLAGPVLKGEAGAAMAKACMQSFMALLSIAKVSDANQRRARPPHSPAWINGR